MTFLIAPSDYRNLSKIERGKICNGCGTKGLGGLLVPDTLYGLSITEPCNIHDFMYHVGKTIHDKEHADRVFLDNMYRVISTGKNWRLLVWLRRQRAYKYYLAVREFGHDAFFNNK